MDSEDLKIIDKADKILRFWANRDIGHPPVFRILWRGVENEDGQLLEVTDLTGKELMKQLGEEMGGLGYLRDDEMDMISSEVEVKSVRKKSISIKDKDLLGKRSVKKAKSIKSGSKKEILRSLSPLKMKKK